MQYTELSAQLLKGGVVVALSSINLIKMDDAGQHTLSLVPEGESPDIYQLVINWKPQDLLK